MTPRRIATLIVLASFLPATEAPAADRPVLHGVADDPIIHGGAVSLTRAEVDTMYVLGGPGRFDGRFEDAAGNPDWHGWTHLDETLDPSVRWQVSDHQPLAGPYSMWCGAAYADGPGYGNNWNASLVFTHVLDEPLQPVTVHWTGKMRTDTELGYDFVHLEFNRAGAWETLSVHDGSRHWAIDQTVDMVVDDYAGADGNEVQLRVRFASDQAWSDEDGLFQSDGACWLDELAVAVDGVVVDSEDFDDQDPGRWQPVVDPGVGDFAQIWSDLDDLDPVRDNRSPQVAFIDDGLVVPGTGGTTCQTWCYGPGGYIVNNTGGLMGPDHFLRNSIESPVLDWPQGCDAMRFAFDAYRHETLGWDSPGIFYRWSVRSTDDPVGSPIEDAAWEDRALMYFGGPQYLRHHEDVTDLLASGRVQVQVRLMVYENDFWFQQGTDGTPAPYFDNVAVLCWPFGGPAMATRSIDLANDGLPASGTLDLVDLGSNSVRFDMARNIAPADHLRNDPGDSIIADIAVLRAGATLVREPRLHVRMRTNPLFDAHRALPAGFNQVGDIVTGFVAGDTVRLWDGQIVEDRWSFDLPDTGFFYPGDVIHYFLEAGDVVAGDEIWSTLPADTAGFASFDPLTRFHRDFTVRALPTQFGPEPGDQPSILIWDDAGSAEMAERWRFALANLGLRVGMDYDLFVTRGASSGVGNGLGGRATSLQLSGYQTLLYTCGSLGTSLLGNGDFEADPSHDIDVVTGWLGLGERSLVVSGHHFVSGMLAGGPDGVAFLNTYLPVICHPGMVGPLIGGQTSPGVSPMPDNGILVTVDRWVASSGYWLAPFDAVQAAGTSVQLAEYLSPDGEPGAYLYAAAVYNRNQADGADIVLLPYDLSVIRNSPDWTPPDGPSIPARAWILGDILDAVGTWSPGPPLHAELPAGRFAVRCYPNPFNPSTSIALDLPRAGEVRVRMYDVRGALVRELVRGSLASGRHEVIWDGRDDAGAPVASGVYFVEARALGEATLARVTLVK